MKAVDLFAGWGGMTEGARQAGVSVVWAANHWPLAVEAHSMNHPSTQHVCQDLRQADWTALPAYDLLLAAPACQGHSEAGQPGRRRDGVRRRHDALRATAWAVVDCAEVTLPRAIVVENVLEFRRWPLFPTWCQALEVLGYQLDIRSAVASELGVPQRRRRLFVLGTRRSTWIRELPCTPELPFGPCVDWAAGDWRPIDTAQQGARRRLSAAVDSFERALVQHTSDHRGIAVTEPIRTITTKDQWCAARRRGREYRPLTLREYARAMGFSDSYRWPQASRADVVKGLGNAVPPPMAREVIAAVTEALG